MLSGVKMKVLVFGYSESPDRYSNKAHNLLLDFEHESIPVNPRNEDELNNLPGNIHTLALYVNPAISTKFQDLLLSIKPKRVIFNPGTESPELEKKFLAQGADVVIGCTLVMLKTGQF